jgi:hypothetical protein
MLSRLGRTLAPRRNAKPRRRLFLHAGLHKTGTTAIQTALAASADRLRQDGLLYPSVGRPRMAGAECGHHNLAWELAGDRRFDPAFGTLDEAFAECAAFPGDAILSSEDFESVLGSPRGLRRLAGDRRLRGIDLVGVIYLRDQVSYAEALFCELLRHGMHQDATAFCDAILRHGQFRFRDWIYHFDYHAMLRQLSSVRGMRVEVRPYAALRGGSTPVDFLHATGFGIERLVDPDRRENPRDSIAASIAHFCAGDGERDVDALAARLQQLLGPETRERRASLGPRRRQAFRRRFAAGNRRLARRRRLPSATLDWSDTPPPGGIDLEQLFTTATARLVRDWLRGETPEADVRARLLSPDC